MFSNLQEIQKLNNISIITWGQEHLFSQKYRAIPSKRNAISAIKFEKNEDIAMKVWRDALF